MHKMDIRVCVIQYRAFTVQLGAFPSLLFHKGLVKLGGVLEVLPTERSQMNKDGLMLGRCCLLLLFPTQGSQLSHPLLTPLPTHSLIELITVAVKLLPIRACTLIGKN